MTRGPVFSGSMLIFRGVSITSDIGGLGLEGRNRAMWVIQHPNSLEDHMWSYQVAKLFHLCGNSLARFHSVGIIKLPKKFGPDSLTPCFNLCSSRMMVWCYVTSQQKITKETHESWRIQSFFSKFSSIFFVNNK